MRLRPIQIMLWITATAAVLGFAVVRLQPVNGGDIGASSTFTPDFSLPDSDGQIRRATDFRGRFLLVFFGFTSCPDVCPTTLSEVAQVMDDLGPAAEQVQPVFISVDPVRDRRLGLAAYTSAFHPAILGLAGNEAQTRAAADSFKIFFKQEADPSVPDGYSIAHTPGLFLIGPDGAWLRQFAYGTPATEILSDIRSRF